MSHLLEKHILKRSETTSAGESVENCPTLLIRNNLWIKV